MADNVAVTAGTGTSIAADDISSVFYQRCKLSLGADGSATDAVGGAGTNSSAVQRVTLATDDALHDKLNAFSASASFTPVASSHTANDVVGGAGTFSSIGNNGKKIILTRATLLINSGTAQATAWRLHLYNVTPPSATTDDGAWDLPSGDQSSYLGFISIPQAEDMGSSQWVEVDLSKQITLSGTALYGYLVNMTTLTTAAVAHTVTLHAIAAS